MKCFNWFFMLLLLFAVSFLVGCNSYTKATYHVKKGKVVKIDIEKVSSPVEQVTNSTKEKTVVYFRNGWGFEMSVSLFTPKNPFPHFKLEGYNSDGGVGTFLKDMTATDIARIILSTRTNLKIDEKGVNSSPPKTEPDNVKGADLGSAKASIVPTEHG